MPPSTSQQRLKSIFMLALAVLFLAGAICVLVFWR